MVRLLCAIGFLACPVAPGSAYPPPPKEVAKTDFDKLARDLGESFVTAANKQDVPALVKLVGFPYRASTGKDLDKPDAVRKELDDVVSGLLGEGVTVAVKEVVAAEKFEEWAAALSFQPEAYKTEAARKSFLDHLGKGGRVVALQFTIDGKKDDDLALLMVKFKDEKAILVGLTD